MTDTRPLTLVVGPPARTGDLAAELRDGLGEQARIVTVSDVGQALAAALDPVALVLVDCYDTSVDAVVLPLKAHPQFEHARVLVVVGAEVRDGARSLDRGWVEAFVGLPRTPGVLAWHARQQLTRWQARYGPDADPASTSRAVEHDSELLRDFGAPEQVLADELVAAIERAMGPRPRLRIPADVRLTRQDRYIDGVYVVLEGEVALTRRVGEQTSLFHHDSTGRILGLLSLASHTPSHFTSTTTTPAVVIHLSTDQLDHAMHVEPQVSIILAATAVTQLGKRLVRSAELQVERDTLISELEDERTDLAATLHQLREARLELVTQARFATLGELSAGIAHELNNPLAALARSAEHLLADVNALLASHPRGDLIANALRASTHRAAVSTREERAARRELAALTRDDALARRLVTAGIRDAELARTAARSRKLAALIEDSAKLGTSLRSIELATEHITRLVSSLRSYARPDAAPVDELDLNASLEDTLNLVSHRLKGVHIEREYARVPLMRARPAQLGQVWTNILVNSADALAGSGTIRVETRVEGNFVAVELSDDGPGIPPQILERVFEPRFTTKHGRVRFGMGMGLGIAARFVHDHGGTIGIQSQPGHTSVLVRLPLAGPPPTEPIRIHSPAS